MVIIRLIFVYPLCIVYIEVTFGMNHNFSDDHSERTLTFFIVYGVRQVHRWRTNLGNKTHQLWYFKTLWHHHKEYEAFERISFQWSQKSIFRSINILEKGLLSSIEYEAGAIINCWSFDRYNYCMYSILINLMK